MLHRALVLGLLATLLSSSPGVTAQVGGGGFGGSPPDDVGTLFVPMSYVPLSDFVEKKRFKAAVMTVDQRILDWIALRGDPVQVAVETSTDIQIFNATSVVGETVRLLVNIAGDCVVVTPGLTHDLVATEDHSIVTHWDDTGMGTQSLGATAGRFVLDFDADTEVESTESVGEGIFSSGGFHVYATSSHHLFSDGSNDSTVENALVPAFERYVGETYATQAPTNLRAIRMSDVTRAATGIPVAHRNWGGAADPFAGAEDDVPVFQIVHAHLVDIGDVYAEPGDENSLASFILPPDWTSAAALATYPILFNGFYDLHQSTFGAVGRLFMEALGEMYNTPGNPRRAVGVLWNGGGATVTTTLHRSAYDNADLLLAETATLARGDEHNVVFVGGSRGGTTALAMAGNPYTSNYTAAYVHAQDPQVRITEAARLFVNPGYRLLQDSVDLATGYVGSWDTNWVDPVNFVPRDNLVKMNLFGTDDDTEIDEDYSIDSVDFRDALEAADPGIVYSLGTQDYSKGFSLNAEYANNLEATDLSVRCQVYYRFGHVAPIASPTYAELLERVFVEKEGGTPAPITTTPGDVELEFFATDPGDPTAWVPVSSPYIPAVLEAPITVGGDQPFTFVIAGEPGATVEIFYAPMISTWAPGDDCIGSAPCDGTSSCLAMVPYPSCFAAPVAGLFGGVTLSAGPVFGTFHAELPSSLLTNGYFWYELYYSPEGGGQPQIGQGDLAMEFEPEEGVPAAVSQIVDVCAGGLDYVLNPPYDQPLLRKVDCLPQVLGLEELTRTGGLSGAP